MRSVMRILLLLSISYFINSCKKTDVPKTVDIYIAGLWYGSGVANFAVYWKNGETIPVSDGTARAVVSAIFVSGNDVYLAGAEEITPYGNKRATYWKNKTRIYLQVDTNQSSEVNSIFISGNDVYVAGYETTNQGGGAKYWKNGIAVNLTNYMGIAQATSIVVKGTDVHVAGFQLINGVYVAKYWKNGVGTNLSSGNRNAEAYSLVISGTDVYIAGKELHNTTSKYVAKYWKNGVAINLTDGTNDAYANSIVVKGDHVYVAGGEKNGGRDEAKYWKNAVGTKLLTFDYGQSYAYSIAVSGTDVYVSTFDIIPNPPYGYNNSWQYWKNGKKETITGIGGKMIIFLVDP